MTYSEVQSTHVENQNKRNLNQSHQPLITQLTHALFSGKNSPNLLIIYTSFDLIRLSS